MMEWKEEGGRIKETTAHLQTQTSTLMDTKRQTNFLKNKAAVFNPHTVCVCVYFLLTTNQRRTWAASSERDKAAN